jgi:hypothetical protein
MGRPFAPIKKPKSIKSFAVVDTETWGLGGKMAFGCIYINEKRKYSFKTKEKFYEIIKREKIKLVYAHNMEFDSIKIRDCSAFEQLKNDSQPIYAGGLLLALTDNHNLEWRDSFTLLRSSVSSLGQNLGLSKLETPDKFINPPKIKTISKTDVEYCYRDCKIVFIFLNRLFDLTGFQKLTIASTAMAYFQNSYLDKVYYKHPLHEEFSKSYYGGRTEAFTFGRVDAKVYDINSLYPFAMLNIVLPDFTRLRTKHNLSLDLFDKYLNEFEGMAEVEVFQPKRRVGILPFRYNERLTFPTGNFSGNYNFNELRFAIKNGVIVKRVIKIVYSPFKIKNFFTDYVTDTYELKNNSEGAEKLLYKYLLNSLYGKFGQRKFDKVEYLNDDDFSNSCYHLIQSKTPFRANSLGSGLNYLCYESSTIEETPHSIFTIASYITSAARIELTKMLLKYESEVIYCDTDSIALERSKIETSKEIGGWDLEPYTIKKVYGNKFYRTTEGLKLKGVPKRAVIYGKKFEYSKFIKSKEAMRTGKKAGTTESFSKGVSFDYTKRLKIGNNSIPLHFD